MTEIIAEISGAHGGSYDNAIKLIKAAAVAKADAVKFQAFDVYRLAAKRAGVLWEGKLMTESDLVKLYSKTVTPREWFIPMIAYCHLNNIAWLSSAFDPEDVAFLESIGCPRYKISAYESLDADLLAAVRATGKPMIVSVRNAPGITFLHASDYNGHFDPLGLSEHSTNYSHVVRYAGVPIVERHIKLPEVKSPDDAFSLTPSRFKTMVALMKS